MTNASPETLDREECLRLLRTAPIGRIVFTADALPSVQPVTFVLHGDEVVFRTDAGSKLDAALRDAVVAFEVDEYDLASCTGWSVTAVGHASVITDRKHVDLLARLPLRPWAPGRLEHFVTISIAILTGRRLCHA